MFLLHFELQSNMAAPRTASYAARTLLYPDCPVEGITTAFESRAVPRQLEMEGNLTKAVSPISS
jgi:hypothetical protein